MELGCTRVWVLQIKSCGFPNAPSRPCADPGEAEADEQSLRCDVAIGDGGAGSPPFRCAHMGIVERTATGAMATSPVERDYGL